MTAVLATVGALFGYMGGATQNDAALYKSNAAIDKTAASDQWNFYQAKSSRQNLAEIASSLPGVDQARFKAKIAQYDADMARRLHVRPGMTGLWQVSGRSDLSWAEAIRLDLYYVDNWSMLQDLVILFRTFRAVVTSHGAR